MLRRIVMLGSEVLRKRAKPVKEVDASVRRLIDDLTATLEEAQGAGLAAPQIGVSKRVFVCKDGDRVLALVNPQIVKRSGHETATEGCLSIPGLQGRVTRSLRVTVRALDRSGRTMTYEVEGWVAREMQHENDHLNGVMFIDSTKDLWWLVQADPAEVEADSHKDESDPDRLLDGEGENGEPVKLKRVKTTAPDVEKWFAEQGKDEGDPA